MGGWKSSLAPVYLASVAFQYEFMVCFGCRVVCTRVVACVGIYTHIHALKMAIKKDPFNLAYFFFSLTLFSVLAESPLKEKVF